MCKEASQIEEPHRRSSGVEGGTFGVRSRVTCGRADPAGPARLVVAEFRSGRSINGVRSALRSPGGMRDVAEITASLRRRLCLRDARLVHASSRAVFRERGAARIPRSTCASPVGSHWIAPSRWRRRSVLSRAPGLDHQEPRPRRLRRALRDSARVILWKRPTDQHGNPLQREFTEIVPSERQ